MELRAPRVLTFVTGNGGKFREAQAALAGLPLRLVQDPSGYTEIQADSLEEVAREGAEELRACLARPFFLDDAGLFIDALKGFPGVYSAHALRTIGVDGLLRLLADAPDRSARFECVIAYCPGPPSAPVEVFRGECRGTIAEAAVDDGHGFGFDPVFVPEGDDRTFAEIPTDEKNRVSHRGRALASFRTSLSASGASGPRRGKAS